MPDLEYTLEELAARLQMQPRTIHTYIDQGLLRAPETMGRNARYTDYHLRCLQAIKTLTEECRLPSGEIRRLVNLAGPRGENEAGHAGAVGEATSATEASATETPPASALDYIRSRRARTRYSQEPIQSPGLPFRRGTSRPVGPLEGLLDPLREQTRNDRVMRKVHGQEWIRLEITPDMELHVRGELSPAQLHDFEFLADLMRHIIVTRKASE